MARYIDADKIPYYLDTSEYAPMEGRKVTFKSDIDRMPTADVEEVVRCKECKRRKTDKCPMYYEEDIEWDDDGYIEMDTIFHDNTTDDSFCSYGERSDT